MRHQKRTRKLGRTSQHRDLMLANLVASLIIHKRVKTTLAKAKSARPLAEKLVTLGKTGTLHARRLAVAKIGQKRRRRDALQDHRARASRTARAVTPASSSSGRARLRFRARRASSSGSTTSSRIGESSLEEKTEPNRTSPRRLRRPKSRRRTRSSEVGRQRVIRD